jgi:hypothetical protein
MVLAHWMERSPLGGAEQKSEGGGVRQGGGPGVVRGEMSRVSGSTAGRKTRVEKSSLGGAKPQRGTGWGAHKMLGGMTRV